MAELTDRQKMRIVVALAHFATLKEVVQLFRDEEGIEIPPRQVGGYDPTRGYFEGAERWKEIFEQERERYLKEVTSVPIANQGFRLNELMKGYERAKAKGNAVLANATLRQAAEEVGGAMTNERNVNLTKVDELREYSPEERRAMLIDKLMEAMASKDSNAPSTATKQ